MKSGVEKLSVGKFQGQVLSAFKSFFDEESLSGFGERARSVKKGVLSEGRHRVVVLDLEKNGKSLKVAVKAFGRQGCLKDFYDFRKGSKAERSFKAGNFLKSRGVGTPQPIAYFDRWEGKHLLESFYLSDYVESLISFKDSLIQAYHEKADCRFLVARLSHIASAIRRMHDVGFWHRDLGNQNMEFQVSSKGEWGEVQFIDLNRGRIREDLSAKERAQDFSRIRLPSAFLNVLVRIYWKGNPPREFNKEMRSRRRGFEWWERSRRWRHPFRKRSRKAVGSYPEVQNIWIWDRESAQASITMERYERKRYYSLGRHFKVAWSVLKFAGRIWREYRRQLPLAYQSRVDLKGRFGVALESTDLDFNRQLELLEKLEGVSVLLRFCHHEGMSCWKEGVAQVKELVASGRKVMIAMVQDRGAVSEPDSWARFLSFVLDEIGGLVTAVEICHAVNRMKWGVHGPDDQVALLSPILKLQEKFPEITFTGPACIDFEYHYVLSAFESAPDGLHYGALSHHLYVDRRGAPENFQGRFSTLEKCGLLRAIARVVPACDDQVIISEVNWPLEGGGIWSPVTATHVDPDAPEHPLSVSEFDYGVYMLRYLVISVCSGFVDRVYWWRLVAHGFGLVDERAEGGWRERIGFKMLRVFLEQLGSATFLEKLEMEVDVYAFRFERGDEKIIMMWCNGRTYSGPWSFEFRQALNATGDVTGIKEVGDSPVYFFL